MNHINPACTETLTKLMCGGLPTGRNGFPLHARSVPSVCLGQIPAISAATDATAEADVFLGWRRRVRYFDGEAKRPGLPPSVAALVTHMTVNSVTVTLVQLAISRKHRLLLHTLSSFRGRGVEPEAGVGA